MSSSINTDVLVIGSGLSGATAAITAADGGKSVTIITKSPQLKSETHQGLRVVLSITAALILQRN